MNTNRYLWCVLALCPLLATCTISEERASATVIVSVVGTNDFHGALIPAGNFGGPGIFSGYLRNLRDARTTDSGGVILLDAGDMWQGTLESNLSEGEAVLKIYNALEYDAAAIGNHEFDFGPAGPASTPTDDSDDPQGALKQRAAEASFPILSANLIDASTGKTVRWPNVSASQIKRVAGVKIGMIGGITEGALATTILANTAGLEIASLSDSIRLEAQKLRKNGANVIVVTTHAGGECSEFSDVRNLTSCRDNSEIFRLARALPRGLVDVIVGGHVHKGIAHEVNGIALISSYSRGTAFGRVDLTVDLASGTTVNQKIYPPQPICEFSAVDALTCGDEVKGDPAATYEGAAILRNTMIDAMIEPALASVRDFKSRHLGAEATVELRHGPTPESPLGNLLMDIALQAVPGADVSLHNTVGGIRAMLPAGPVTYGRIYEVFPFDNRITTFSLSGRQLRAIFSRQFESGRWRSGISGVRISAACDEGNLQVHLMRPNGALVSDDEQLLVVTNDFLASGGDGIFTPVIPDGGFPVDPSAPLVRDAMVNWIERRGGSLSPGDFYDAAAPRFEFSQPLPIDCNE